MIGAGIGLAIAGPIGAAIGFLGAKLLGGLGKVLGSIVNALFGTKTSIVGQGIYGGAQSLGSILSGGFDASYYTDIKKTKKFFGISVGSSYSTQYAAASAELEQQFSLIFSGFYDAISAAAGPLGMSLDEVQSRLAGFVVNIGKIDLKGLTGEQIQEKLTAVFGAAADSIARAAIPGLEQFQKVGEGYFETLVRVASSIEAASSSLSLLGTSIEGLSLSAKMNLFDLFGSRPHSGADGRQPRADGGDQPDHRRPHLTFHPSAQDLPCPSRPCPRRPPGRTRQISMRAQMPSFRRCHLRPAFSGTSGVPR